MDLRKYTRMPPVGAAMTPFPHFVEAGDSVEKIEELMDRHEIRHVPVQEGGHVIGIVSERDLHHVVNPSLPPRDKSRIRARDVLRPDPYVVEIDAPLAAVVSTMAERQLGSAIVVKRGKLAGILSVTDVCRILGEILAHRFPGSGNDAA